MFADNLSKNRTHKKCKLSIAVVQLKCKFFDYLYVRAGLDCQLCNIFFFFSIHKVLFA